MRAFALLISALWCGVAAALPPTELARSEVLGCLLPAESQRGSPEYPFDLYKNHRSGRIKASVTFPGGLLGPDVEILDLQGDAGFAAPVQRYLRRLSAPCVPKGQSATLTFEFVFRSDDERVTVDGPVDPKDAARQRTMACLTHQDGNSTPVYPMSASRSNVQGRVLAMLTFRSASEPPVVKLLHRESALLLADAVKSWVAGLRLPCLKDESLALIQLHEFRLDGETFGFKPMALTQLMAVTKDIEHQRIAWDTTQMGCPFRLRFTYYRPLATNLVRQVGAPDPRRQPLIDWLNAVEIAAVPGALDAIFADTADVTVACAKFNLNPKE